MSDGVYLIIKCIVMVLCTVLVGFVIPLIKAKTTGTKYEYLMKWVQAAVENAEQTIHGEGVGHVKKTEVLNFLMDFCVSAGIQITQEQLSNLIESAVFTMNLEK